MNKILLTCLIIGLVNPKMGTKIETVKREGIDIVFAIDGTFDSLILLVHSNLDPCFIILQFVIRALV